MVDIPEPPVSGGGVEVMFEMLSATPSHQPLTAIPLTETTHTCGDRATARQSQLWNSAKPRFRHLLLLLL